MSSNFIGVTFAEQSVTPSDDALIHRAILPDGILSGCELSYAGSTLTMGAGSLLACGRQFRHPNAQNWPIVEAVTGYARLLLTIDLSRTATEEAFDQVVDTIEYSTAADGFPALVRSDINGAGTKYQIVICVVSLGTGGITGIVSQLSMASLSAAVAKLQIGVKIEKLWENNKPTKAFAAQTIALDMSKYAGVSICFKGIASGSGQYMSEVIPYGAKAYIHCHALRGDVRQRYVKVREEGVVFDDGYNGDEKNNSYAVPICIYGWAGATGVTDSSWGTGADGIGISSITIQEVTDGE